MAEGERRRRRPIYANPAARSWTWTPPAAKREKGRAEGPRSEPEQGHEDGDEGGDDFNAATVLNQVRAFHARLPGFTPTPLIPLSLNLAGHDGARDGVPTSRKLDAKGARVFVKDESLRLGLPAYKILGASWGVWRAVVQRVNSSKGKAAGQDLLQLRLDAELDEVAAAAREAGLVLFAATDGNFGRAVARMGTLLGVAARIYVPEWVGPEVRRRIEGEGRGGGVEVHVVAGDYDAAVARASVDARAVPGKRGLHVQDSAFEGYEEITGWVVEGYGTMMAEVEEQLAGSVASVIVVPVGAGSLCHAVVVHGKSDGREVQVLAVEPDKAACLHESLWAGRSVAVEAEPGIMDGLTCPTVSPVSWPVLEAGVDASVTVSDAETHRAVEYLASKGVRAGPCGAAALAGLRRVAEEAPEAIRLGPDSVVVILCTEGVRHYDVPEGT